MTSDVPTCSGAWPALSISVVLVGVCQNSNVTVIIYILYAEGDIVLNDKTNF